MSCLVPRLCLTLSLAVGAGCLPQGALSRHEALPAERYQVHVDVAVTTSPESVLAPFDRSWRFELVTRWARDFRDGSRGRYVRFERSAPDPGADSLHDAWLELRTFDSGQILAVNPLAGHVGRDAGNLETLDLVWAALSPAPPDFSRRADVPLLPAPEAREALTVGVPIPDARTAVHRAVTSIPTILDRNLRLRTVLASEWWRVPTEDAPSCAGVRRCVGLAWTGTLEGTTEGDAVAARGARPAPRPVRVRGRASGHVVLDTDSARVLASGIDATREVTTHWPEGALASLGTTGAQDLVQHQTWRITVTRLGTTEAPRFATVADAHASARGDAAPLTLADGSTADGGTPAGLPAPEALPFLLLPDRLSSGLPETR